MKSLLASFPFSNGLGTSLLLSRVKNLVNLTGTLVSFPDPRLHSLVLEPATLYKVKCCLFVQHEDSDYSCVGSALGDFCQNPDR